MDNLPLELLESILSILTVPDLDAAQNVCQSWRQVCDSVAIPVARRKLLVVKKAGRSDGCMNAVRRRTKPFVQGEFNRAEYLSRMETALPDEFSRWILESEILESGWHWPSLQDEHNKERYDELGIDWVDAMSFSRHMKPGYTLLPRGLVRTVEDPDYSAHNNQNTLHYAGSWQRSRPIQSKEVKALLLWADLSGYAPRITLLILDGSDRSDGVVWLCEIMSQRYLELGTDEKELGLTWIEPLGSWATYLGKECRALQERYRTLPQYRMFRSGGRVWSRQVHY